MKAEIISVGTEILLGQIVDTNSQFLAGGLADAQTLVFQVLAVVSSDIRPQSTAYSNPVE